MVKPDELFLPAQVIGEIRAGIAKLCGAVWLKT